MNVAFLLAGPSGMTAYDVARVVLARLRAQEGISSAEVAGGGFLNVTLDDRALAELVAALSGGSYPAPGSDSGLGRGRDFESGSGPVRGAGPETVPAPGPDTPADDIAHWSAATGDSPAALAVRTAQASSLFRVQYAHARACAMSRNARDLGFRAEPHAVTEPGSGPAPAPAADPARPDGSADSARPDGSADPARPAAGPRGARQVYGAAGKALLALLADHRRVGEQRDAARHARHLVAVGDAFFDFHDQCPPLPSGDEKPGAAHRARLALVEATGAVLAGGLTQLGVSAPAHL